MKEETIRLKSIGIIRTPFRNSGEAPKQGIFAPDSEGIIELFEAYKEGLKDLERFSHAILVFYFHEIMEERLTGTPPMDTRERGVFSIRSPFRPNHIGLTVVRIQKVEDVRVIVSGVDMLDQTPLLDIKPHIRDLDNRDDSGPGWLKDIYPGEIPEG